MLKIENLSYRVGNKTILEDISWECHPGKINLVLGSNGAGKSTLIKLIAGSQKPTHGQIIWDQHPIAQLKDSAKYRSVLSQHLEISFPLTVREVVALGRHPHYAQSPTKRDWNIVDECIELFDLHDFTERAYNTLSGGERQRVHFARTHAQIFEDRPNGTSLLLLDEPLTFLDIRHQYAYMNLLSELVKRRNLIVVGVVHDLNLAMEYADEILLLNHGKTQISGTMDAVMQPEQISRAFGVKTERVNNHLLIKGLSNE